MARPVGYRVPGHRGAGRHRAAAPRAYLADRRPGESFREFCARHTDEELRALLAGVSLTAVARDASPGRTPHSVDG